MSSKFEGRLISAVTPTTSGTNYTGSASGIWDLNVSTYAKQAGEWPKGSVIPTVPTFGDIAVTSSTSDIYFDNVTLLLNFDDTGTPAFIDKSINNAGITTHGISAANTVTKKFGTGSLPLTTTTGLDVPSELFMFGSTTDFTIEFWVYLNSRTGYSTICGQWLSPNTFNIMLYHLDTSGTIGIQYTNEQGSTAQADSGLPNTTIPLTTWTHVAFARSGTTCKVFINGTGTTLSSNPYIQPQSTSPVSVGNVSSQYGFGIDGYIDDFRVTKGVCRYVSNFTAPTSAHPLSSGLNMVVPYNFSSDGGARDVTYTLDVSDGRQFTGTTSPFTVSISNNTVYTFSISASNISGYSTKYVSSNIMRLGTPTIGTPVFGNTTVSVPFTKNDTNASGLPTTYTVRSNPGNKIATGTTSPITVTGLTNGTPYTFTVTASNDIGVSSTSATSSSMVPATVPSSPVIGSAVAGNSLADVSFTYSTDNNGDAISGYTVTSSPGGITGSGTTSPIRVSGLNVNLFYTFTVVANNKAGSSIPSAASNSLMPAIVPTAPTGVSTVYGYANSAPVSFTTPSNNGGYAVTQYTVTSSPGGITATGTSSPITVTGLTNNVPYTFTVFATNFMGNSLSSSVSNSIAPGVPPAPTLTGVTYSGTATASIAFTAPTLTGGYPITGYTVTRNDGATATGTVSPITMSNNFTDGVLYTFTVKASNSAGTGPVSNTSAQGNPKFPVAIVYNSATANLTISKATLTAPATAAGWNGTSPLYVTVTNNTNIYSSSPATAAMIIASDVGTLPTGSQFTLVNNSNIGGAGGNYTSVQTGGIGLTVQAAIRINNTNGVIAGGGGAGGLGAFTNSNSYTGTGAGLTASGWVNGGTGGNGNNGGNIGIRWWWGAYDGTDTYGSGRAGTQAIPGLVPWPTGAGILAYYGQGSCGLSGGGGGLGSAGGAGGEASTSTTGGSIYTPFRPAAGNAGGAAVSGNGNVTWVANGTRYGALV